MERKNEVYLTKLAEQAERYEDAVNTFKKVCEIDACLSLEERKLMLAGYKNIVAARRASWRVIHASEQEEELKGDSELLRVIKGYRQKIEIELESICNDAVHVLDTYLIPAAASPEAAVFYNKMKGDYYRYLAEIKVAMERTYYAYQSQKAYQTATSGTNQIAATDPIRLGLALDFSVFYDEILEQTESAYQIAQAAFHEADFALCDETRDEYCQIMDMLAENITRWSRKLNKKKEKQSRYFPPSITRCIQLNISEMGDFIASRAIGPTWKESVSFSDLPDQFPLLMENRTNPYGPKLRFYSLIFSKQYEVTSPISSEKYLSGSFNGYMSAEKFEWNPNKDGVQLITHTSLVNPLIGHEIELPPTNGHQYPNIGGFYETILDTSVVRFGIEGRNVAVIGIKGDKWVYYDLDIPHTVHRNFVLGNKIFSIDINNSITRVHDITTGTPSYTIPAIEEMWVAPRKVYIINGDPKVFLVLLKVKYPHEVSVYQLVFAQVGAYVMKMFEIIKAKFSS